ncbi:MAG: LytTR family transcriptional regulator DNA-binding domain-containing protein [Bacteroidales bacterium]|nr:LytTR family transcriptional regulator DNA-binding domain-containing protein [Bacteroidales bacterium]
MLKILNKPYPFNDDLKFNTLAIFFITLILFVFLYLFEPFDMDSLPVRQKYIMVSGFSVITFLALTLHLMIIPSFFSKGFSSTNWTIKKEILWNLWILFTILAGYFLFTRFMGLMKFGFDMVITLVFVAIIPISIIIIINYNKMIRSHLKLADEMNKKLRENKDVHDKVVYFNSDYQKDNLVIKINALLLIRSANNYIEVFWREGELIKSQMIRMSLLNAEKILKEYKFVLRCHRSYLININHIEKVEGNSQGYKLYFENVNFPIPVSKNSIDKLQGLI